MQAGGLSALGLGLPRLLAGESRSSESLSGFGKAKSCVMLYMLGGPPQQETFDMKPSAPGSARSLFQPISTTVPGVQICELLPKLAQNAHRYAILRSTHHGGAALFHGAGVHYNLTGWPNFPREGEPFLDRRDSPSIGAVLQALHGDRNRLPASIQLPMWITQDGPGREWAGQHAGVLGRKYDPLVMAYDRASVPPGTLLPGFALRDEISPERLRKRLALLHEASERRSGDSLDGLSPQGTPSTREWTAHQAQALDVLDSSKAWRAFSIDDESPQTRAAYGDDRLGRSCLVARRLIEAGARLVTVVFIGWDTHANHLTETRDQLLPPMDRAFAALLEDLDARGLLDETLVAWTGEFGRTPSMNGNNQPGRDHWARVYSTVLAGAGVQGGRVIGRSDNLAGEPADDPVHVSDFVATIYHALGHGPRAEVEDMFGRRHYVVAGRPVLGVY